MKSKVLDLYFSCDRNWNAASQVHENMSLLHMLITYQVLLQYIDIGAIRGTFVGSKIKNIYLISCDVIGQSNEKWRDGWRKDIVSESNHNLLS